MDFRTMIRRWVPRPVLGAARNLWLWTAQLLERRLGQADRDPYLPPVSLRCRVHGSTSIKSFLEVGRRCAEDLRVALGRQSRDIYSFGRILDFGCGCGRAIRWFADHPESSQFYGTDIDADAITWCRKNMGFATFSVNDMIPPMRCDSGSFDLIYAISVFTHLDEDLQFQWLAELKRVARPNCLLLVSIQGQFCWSKLSAGKIAQIQEQGIVFDESGSVWQGIFPESYTTAYHTKEYVCSRWSQHFKVVDYVEKGMNNHQDLVVLRNVQSA